MSKPKISKVTGPQSFRIGTATKTLDTEQTTSQRQKAVRLYCRAMIRLYLQDTDHPQNGKGLGLL